MSDKRFHRHPWACVLSDLLWSDVEIAECASRRRVVAGLVCADKIPVAVGDELNAESCADFDRMGFYANRAI